jgi:hypothetical protein
VPEDPGGYVYGTILVATLLAAESPGRETYARTTIGVALALVLYWLAISYAEYVNHRAERQGHFTLRGFAAVAGHETAVVIGALGPLVVVLVCWAAGVSLHTAIVIASWSAAAIIAATELILGLRSHLDGVDLAVQTTVGVLFGLAVVALRVLLH